ncbi:UNVERIFIED_CONTAM: putative disease resistance protein [Sesamum radiatum]|uniref:Disease resistance protein n=1 Tax=Sesamum radiatum TaxID=300843 RepID=A0AAW2WMV1_SESRA
MAHSALVSLMNTLELILHSDRFHFFHAKHHIVSIYRKVRLLQTLFQDSPRKSSQEDMDSLEIRIRDSASVIEDAVEFHVSEQVYEDADRFIALLDPPTGQEKREYQDLDEVIVEIDSIVEELLNDRRGLKDLLPRKDLPVLGSSRHARVGKNVMVGFDEDVMELKHRLTGWESKLQAIPITGMGGMEVWDDLKRIFPDDVNGSRIMLTTRLLDVAVYATDSFSPPHQICLLDEEKSWHLLCQEVFGQEDCPPEFQELEDIGKMIARNCNGLPLATSVVGRLLANSTMTREFWGYIAENVNSVDIETDEHCSEILSLSYNHLPHHLKPCFLYFGAFRGNYEIPVTKLIKLWIAEGFL